MQYYTAIINIYEAFNDLETTYTRMEKAEEKSAFTVCSQPHSKGK